MSEEFAAWDYPGDFLKQFPANHQGVVGTVFCHKVRAGARDPITLLEAVERHALDRLENPFDSDTPEGLETMRILAELIGTPESARFALFILWREGLSFKERQRLKAASKAAKGDEYARQAMAQKPPTDKQLALLKAKGCRTVPKTRLEASELIGAILNGRRAVA